MRFRGPQALKGQMGRLAWSQVPLLLPTGEDSGRSANELFEFTAMCSEYQLFWGSDADYTENMPQRDLFTD